MEESKHNAGGMRPSWNGGGVSLEEGQYASTEGCDVADVVGGGGSSCGKVLGQLTLQLGDEIEVGQGLDTSKCSNISLRDGARCCDVRVEDSNELEDGVHGRAMVAWVAAILETILQVVERLHTLVDVGNPGGS